LKAFRDWCCGYKPAMPDEPYADPQDLYFGKAAADKEKVLDSALKAGKSPEQLDADEGELRRHGDLQDVRPGGKGEPLDE
jgi:hypothetical protein